MTAAIAVLRQAFPPVALREAHWGDREAIWAWNNAPEVRALSRDPRPISALDHARWFAARLTAGLATWIVEVDGEPVGVVRLDRLEGSIGRISIALASDVRGQGIGRRAIAAACAAWAAPVLAEILDTNAASRAAFEASGFQLRDQHDDVTIYLWTPEAT